MIPLEFDKPRNLKFDIRAIKDLEAQMSGLPLAVIIGQLASVGVTALTTALWAGLKHEDAGLTIRNVTSKLQDYVNSGKSLKPIARALNDAIQETGLLRSDDDEEPEGNERTTETTSA